jgi:hypothetical protein
MKSKKAEPSSREVRKLKMTAYVPVSLKKALKEAFGAHVSDPMVGGALLYLAVDAELRDLAVQLSQTWSMDAAIPQMRKALQDRMVKKKIEAWIAILPEAEKIRMLAQLEQGLTPRLRGKGKRGSLSLKVIPT